MAAISTRVNQSRFNADADQWTVVGELMTLITLWAEHTRVRWKKRASYCGSVAAAVILLPDSAVSVWIQLHPLKPLTGRIPPTSTKPLQYPLKLHHLSSKFPLLSNLNRSHHWSKWFEKDCDPVFTSSSSSSQKTKQAKPYERSHWSEGKHCHLLNTFLQTARSRLGKMLEIQSEVNLETRCTRGRTGNLQEWASKWKRLQMWHRW